MPVVEIKHPNDQIVTGIWHITESLEQLALLAALSEMDLETCKSWKNTQRQKQWIGVRALLRDLLSPFPTRVSYNRYGKPFLDEHNSFISISHSGDYIAVAVSELFPVGIDIEILHPRIRKIADIFLNNNELNDLKGTFSLLSLFYYWCTKEAVFKALPEPCADFRNSIYVHPIDYLCKDNLTGLAEVDKGKEVKKFLVFPYVFSDKVMVTCIQKSTR